MSPTDAPRDLLTRAEKDCKSALILARSPEPEMEAPGFHLQQATGKALKAWLARKRIEYPRTHDLNPLPGQLEDAGEDMGSFWRLLALNPFAVQFRYETAGAEFPDFELLAQLANQRLAHVQSRLAAA
jgi:HEPN domain-containing protein